MPRPIEHRTSSSYPAAQVFAALTDESYLRARLARVGGKSSSLTSFSVDGDTTNYVLRQSVDAEHLPPAVRKIISGDLAIERTESWTAGGSNGEYHGTISAVVPGTPSSVHGTTRLIDTTDGSELTFSGSVKAGLPLIGGKLEEMIVEQLGRLLRAEAEFTQHWLESRV